MTAAPTPLNAPLLQDLREAEGGGARKHAITARASVWALAVELMQQADADPLGVLLFLTNECNPELFVEVLEVRILFSLGNFPPLFFSGPCSHHAGICRSYSILKTCAHT